MSELKMGPDIPAGESGSYTLRLVSTHKTLSSTLSWRTKNVATIIFITTIVVVTTILLSI